jgi:hypothetical protein
MDWSSAAARIAPFRDSRGISLIEMIDVTD